MPTDTRGASPDQRLDNLLKRLVADVAEAEMPDADLPHEIARRFLRGGSFGERKSRFSDNSKFGDHTSSAISTDKGHPISGRSGTGDQEPAAGDRHDSRTVRGGRRLLVGWALMAALGWSGCRSSPRPEVLFAEAETLRLRYEKEASHQAIAKYREAIAVWERQGQKRRRRQSVAARRIGLRTGNWDR